ncbi:Polycystin-1 [Dissostichus eleginoides]|uniref:Polycystin-1 n=1 Tax=Dissostichus eleginoides TaxID=100907 RepID=A0AAD9BFL0_DISEL|nr:Polycystin-1 [Dissostichus eleginoides]
MIFVPVKQTLWILCVFLSTAAKEDSPCPEGGQIHVSSRRCFFLSESPSSWPDAQTSCRETRGGDVASAESLELQDFIQHSFPVKTTVWVWVKGSGGDGSDQKDVMEPVIPVESPGGCTQMALGTKGQRRKSQCAGRYLFLCEKEVKESFPSVDSYLTGSVLMSGDYTQIQIQPLPNAPDIGQITVEMQLFPGLWFSHAGQLVSVELVVQPSPDSSLSRVQILRPYCNPNHHLVPPGCSALFNPFSCCSAVPLCNTTGGCSTGQYWCHLLEVCVPTTSPCSPYDSETGARGFVLPPRYTAIPPFYHLVADLPLRVNPSSELTTISLILPDRAIMVYPDDIVAVQHTRDSGDFLTLRQWVDGVVCDLRMMYVDNLHRGTEHEDNPGFTERETTTALNNQAFITGPTPNLGSKFRLDVIHPAPDANNQIHVQINVPTLIVVKVLFGKKASSTWSAPVLQIGVPFLSSCPKEVAQSWDGCKRQSHDAWFSSVTMISPTVGFETLNISVMDAENSQSVSLRVCSYEEVTGLSVEPHGCRRMIVDTPQSFIAKVQSGSSVKFTWVIDYLENFAHEGESYSVVFKKPAEYKLRVTASNPVSSQSQQTLLTADEITPLSDPQFLLVREVIAVDATHRYTLRVKVDISLPVTFRWDFGDGRSEVIHTQSAPCQTMEGLMERGEKQVYVQDSVNYTYPIPDDYTLHVQVSNQYDHTEASMKIRVRPQLNHLLISSNVPVPLVNQTLILEATVEPSTYAVVYTWDFGDSSESLQSIHHKVNHSFISAGVYNVTVCANNTLTVLTSWIMVEVLEKISGLTVSYNGPSELNVATDFRATVTTGNNLTWDFDFGDGSFQTFIYTFPYEGIYQVSLNVSNGINWEMVSHSVTVQDAIEGLTLNISESSFCTEEQVTIIPTISKGSNVSFAITFKNKDWIHSQSVLEGRFTTSSLPAGKHLVTVKGWNHVSSSEVSSSILHTLDLGQYFLVFTVSLQGTPLLVQRNISVTVVHSALVAVIKGGSHRLWPSLSDLVLDGSESEDPDEEPGVDDTLQYHWTFMPANSSESHFAKQPKTTNSSKMTVLGTQLHSGTVYVFTLTVHKTGRSPVSFNQTVTMSEAPVFPVIVDCVSCSLLSSPHQISYTTPTVLSGQCGQCDDRAQYKWSAEDQTGVTLDLNEVSTSTSRHSPNLVVRSGLCKLSPESDIRLLETVVTYNCSGWQDDESRTSQLIYTFQVAPCHPNGLVCPLLTLYRGTRSAYGSLVPMGSPGQERSTSVISVTLLVEDHLGSKVIALNRMLTVETPPKDAVANQWLRNKSQTELWALVQQGNPQEIIPYSIALTSKLNQMEAGQTAVTLLDRREIRENVTRVLASLPLNSMLNVDQISSALSLSTAVPSELVCEKCQEKVLEAVGKMIHVMEEQMSPGVLSAVETGRNILNIIGSTLAAVSIRASSSDHDTLHLASSNVLLALNHAGALMRSLMHAQINDKAPLLLSNDYINTISFHGDPSELLCTQKSNQHQIVPSHRCQFLIPSSLTAHLQNQKTEIVQVLFDADLGSNPFLTAADPPISTSLVAMELTTPEGQPITIQDLDPDQAIRVTLPNKHHIGQDDGAVDGLDENAGLYISFNFTLDSGATPVSLGHVRIEVSSAVPGTNASWDSLVREWALNLSDATPFMEETIFLSPLLNRTDQPLSVHLSSSLVSGGPVCVSMCVFSAVCQYYSVQQRRWSSEGLQPLEGSTLQAAHCLTQHLTMFGASMFLHPGAVVLLPPPGGPVRNLLVGMVCAVLVLIHLLLGLIAHKLDHLERTRLSRVPLCGRPGLHQYRVLVKTGRRRGAGTTAHVGISLYGVSKSGARHLRSDGAFQRGGLDMFHLETDESLGEVWKIRIWHDNTGLDPSWFVEQVVVWDPQTDHMFFFLLEDWLSVENQKNGSVEKEVLASCPEELSQFRRVFSSQLVFGMSEHHLWLSLWERPPHSRFSRGQRVTCSAVVLHLYLALGALWYGAVGTQGLSGPVSARLLVNMEAVSVGMTVAALVFPLQWFLCFLFRKSHSQVTVDTSVPPSPVCHSVEMDVFLGQSDLSGPSFLSLSDSSSGPSSLLDSKALDSSILDFWAASGLAPQKDGVHQEGGVVETWPSCDSLLNLPACITETPILCKASLSSRQLRRKKQIRLAAPASNKTPTNQNMKSNLVQVHSQNLTTLLTLSEEDLLMSIAAASEDSANLNHSNSDSGRDSPRTISSLSTTRSRSCSSWSEVSESVFGLRSPSVISVDSVASTFLPSPSPDSSRSPSITRVSRGVPGLLLPPWTLTVIYPLLSSLLIASLSVIGLYGSSFSRALVLMWLLSSLSAFLTSALLLEPLKVCVQALICTLLWRPVDPEVEDHLALQSSVDLKGFGDDGGRVRPPCGFSLLQAREEARKLRALRALMRRCVSQLSFLLLVLMLNYQAGVEQRDARLLRSSVRRELHSEGGGQNLTSLRGFKTLSLDFTHFHRESGLFVCVSIKLEWAALTVLLLVSALLMLFGGFWSMFTERSQYFGRFRNWFQLLLALLSLTTSILQLCFLSQASNCVSELRSDPDSFVDFLPAALLSERSSQSAAVLLTLLLLKLLGSLRFVRRWGVLVQLFSRSVEGFLSLHQSGVSVLSMLRGRASLRTLCRIHPVLGPLYGLLIVGGGVWILARICGAVLILAYRVERAQLYRPTFEPQDYEMFRHSVKFEGLDAPPSRSSQESRLSSCSPSLSSSSSSSSPRPPSSSLSLRSEDSFDVQPHFDRLLPCVTSLLSRFDQINQITDDVHDLEIKLEDAQVRRRKISEEGKRAEKPKEVKGEGKEAVREVRHRKIGLLHPKVSLPSSFFVTSSSSSSSCRIPRARSTFSESESAPYHPRESCKNHDGLCGLNPAAFPGNGRTPRRRAWHSGSSHSADAAQRILQTQGGVALSGNGGKHLGFTDRPRSEEGVRRKISEGVPVKRKAWIEQD